MTVWAHWSQIGNRINDISLANLCKRHQMVNVNIFAARFAVNICEAEPARDATITVMLETSLSSGVTALVAVHRYLNSCPFHEWCLMDRQFFREDEPFFVSDPSDQFKRTSNLIMHLPDKAIGVIVAF